MPRTKVGYFAEIVRNLRLVYRLLRDPRVPVWLKAIPALAVAYLFFPLDLIADPILGLGQLDDLAVILLGIRLFLELCPAELVDEHLKGASVIDAEYREVAEEPETGRPPAGLLSQGNTSVTSKGEPASNNYDINHNTSEN